MLAEWLMKLRIREAKERGYADGQAKAMQLVLEADKQRREGETLAQAIARLQAERENPG